MTETTAGAENIIDVLFDLFARSGARAYQDGAVTMSEHMLQAAALAERAGAPPHLVAAALLHDVGHFGTDFPENYVDGRHAAMLKARTDRRHEEAGARLIEPFFGSEVSEPIRHAVKSKT